MYKHIPAAGLAAYVIACASHGALVDRFHPLTPVHQHSEVELIHTIAEFGDEEEVRIEASSYEMFDGFADWSYDAAVDHGWASQSVNTWATGASVRMKSSSPNADAGAGSYEAGSLFTWTFMMDERASFVFAGSLFADLDRWTNTPGEGWGRMTFAGPDLDIEIQSIGVLMTFEYTGMLEVGAYTLEMETCAMSDFDSGADVSLAGDLRIAAIPPPGVAGLLLIAAVGQARRRRR